MDIRRPALATTTAATTVDFALFDAHLHIVDPRFPLIRNAGYLPDPFTADDYRARLKGYRLAGGAVVSGSFQGFDQGYLVAALERLGPGFVGVTQLPAMTPDAMFFELDAAGVRALRFNVRRGGSEDLRFLDRMARRVHELVGWHVELYADAAELGGLRELVAALPAASIDHLGLSRAGFATLAWLAERGVRVKATGFGRLDFDVRPALRALYAANPYALMFGTDLPSTRAPRAYIDGDFLLVADTLGEQGARRVLHDNAQAFYRVAARQEACA
jgi:predicted TIM-barrel fold metal-dependent hydrolase